MKSAVTALPHVPDAREDLLLLLDSIRDYAIFLLDPAGRVATWNAGAERIKGYRADEILGRHFSVFYPPEDVAAGKPQQVLALAERVGRCEDDGWRVRKDGSRFWAGALVTALRGPSGELRGFGKVTRDLGERRFGAHIETLLSESLDYAATLDRLARVLVPGLADWCSVEILEDGEVRNVVITHVDPAKASLARELRARLPPRPDDQTGTMAVLRTGRSEVVSEVTDEMLVGAAGGDAALLETLRRLELRSVVTVPLRAHGRVLGAMTLASTESGRRYDEQALSMAEEVGRRAGIAVDNARAYREAREAVKLRDEFLSIAGHELRTPLTALQLQLQSLELAFSRGHVAGDLERWGSRVRKTVGHAQRLQRLIDQLLDVSRITSRRLTLEREPTDLGEMAREVVDRHATEAARVGSPVTLVLSGDLRGRWDRARLDQVVTNLLSNALKYGAGKPVHVTVRGDGRSVEIEVRDEGIGIEVAAQARIFGRFERAVSERHYGGLGLGLWIVRELVEAHGGKVGFESEPGRGSTFHVRLPSEPADG